MYLTCIYTGCLLRGETICLPTKMFKMDLTLELSKFRVSYLLDTLQWNFFNLHFRAFKVGERAKPGLFYQFSSLFLEYNFLILYCFEMWNIKLCNLLRCRKCCKLYDIIYVNLSLDQYSKLHLFWSPFLSDLITYLIYLNCLII